MAPLAALLPSGCGSPACELSLGGLEVRPDRRAAARDGSVRFGLEARLAVLGRPRHVQLDDLAVRCGLEKGVARSNCSSVASRATASKS